MTHFADIVGQEVCEMEGITSTIQQLINDGRDRVRQDGKRLVQVVSISHSVTPAGDGRRFIVTVVQNMRVE